MLKVNDPVTLYQKETISANELTIMENSIDSGFI